MPERLTSILATLGECSGNLRFHPFALHDAANGEHLAAARAAAGDHHAVENLDALFLAFENPGVDVDRVADLELGTSARRLLFSTSGRICSLME